MSEQWEPGKLTPAEEAVMELLIKWIEAFKRLPAAHPGEWSEAVPHIHHLQTMVMVRPLLRSQPQDYRSTDEFKAAYSVAASEGRLK